MDKVEIKLRIDKRNHTFKFQRVNTEHKPCTALCPYSDICEDLRNPYIPENKMEARMKEDEDFCHFCSSDAPDLLGISREEFTKYIPEEGTIKPNACRKRKTGKTIEVPAGGMTFKFIEHKVPEGEEIECPKICPLADICENLLDPRDLNNTVGKFYNFCARVYIDGDFDVIPDMTEAEVIEEYKKVGIEIKK